MKEHAFENGKKVDLDVLKVPRLPAQEYAKVHQRVVIACHDVIIEYGGGALLIVRDKVPAKHLLWPIGGRIQRGMPLVESLRQKVREECGLEIEGITELGVSRTYFDTDPFGHGKGTDTINVMFFARGKGTIQLDQLHKNPTTIKPKEYTSTFRATLHPYVQEIMDKAMGTLKKTIIK